MKRFRPSKVYAAFHGRLPDAGIQVPWKNPSRLVLLGRAVEIVYESDKLNGNNVRDGKPALYRHKFHNDDLLCTDPEGKQLYIIGPRLHVEDRGIVD